MKHFTLSEFFRSNVAERLGIVNTTDDAYVRYNLNVLVAAVLDPVREHISAPIIITSGYRCPELNRVIGGSANSQHMKGMAADFVVPKALRPAVICYIMEERDFDQLIIYRSFIHVSYNVEKPHKNRFQVIVRR